MHKDFPGAWNFPGPGDGRDERFAQIDLRATAVSGLVLIVTLIVAWLVEIARGHNGNPYGWILATGGVAYVLAVAFFRWRGLSLLTGGRYYSAAWLSGRSAPHRGMRRR